MNRLLPIICAAALAVTATGATLAPAYAQSPSAQQSGFERQGDDVYYNGQRGSRTERPGYRQYNGFWFPEAAFAAILGAASGLPSRHVAWCKDRYRSYRVSDNTFQPNNGPRKPCVSPYWGQPTRR
jgi:hypothetical protein